MSREAVANALLNLINTPMTTAGAVEVSRRLKHWHDVPPEGQPAVYIASGTRTPTSDDTGKPLIWREQFNIYIYAYEPDNTQSPSTKINNLLDALEAALAPSGRIPRQTLGGLVSHCRIAGAIETDEGVLDAQGMAIVPIEVLYS